MSQLARIREAVAKNVAETARIAEAYKELAERGDATRMKELEKQVADLQAERDKIKADLDQAIADEKIEDEEADELASQIEADTADEAKIGQPSGGPSTGGSRE